jgi:hypothetical protein
MLNISIGLVALIAVAVTAIIIINDTRATKESIKATEEAMKNWRKIEKLNDYTELFHVGSPTSGVFSIYQPEMTHAEKLLVDAIADRFNPHCIFADTYLRKSNGKTAQIDILAISKRGIIVIESKDYKGWIFGNANSQRWTQMLNYGKSKTQFYNPIKQNASHIAAIKQAIGFPNIKAFSLIIFSNEAEIKRADYIPKDCYVLTANRIKHVLDLILSGNEVLRAPM